MIKIKINVVDSIMGSGKTSAIINMINESDEFDKFIYITPYLEEVARIEQSCVGKNFKQPVAVSGSKINGIKKLLINDHNIVSTHSLFHLFDEDIFNLIKTKGYKLILDEVTTVVEPYNINKKDIDMIFSQGKAHVDEHDYVIWDDADYDGVFEEFKKLCDIKSLCMYGDSIIVWLFPMMSFEVFSEIYILTYMFHGQIQKWYYDMFNTEYEYFRADVVNGKYVIIPGQQDNRIDKSLINICEHQKLNDIGELPNTLSKSWYSKSIQNKLINNLKLNTENYFKHILEAKSDMILWTTFKEYQKKVKGKGYTKAFIPLNMRASNEYRNRNCLAYLCNRFLNPVVIKFFEKNNIEINQDAYALSEMLQWIWRSAVRDGSPVNIYIPSKRMRTLLIEWLNGEIL